MEIGNRPILTERFDMWEHETASQYENFSRASVTSGFARALAERYAGFSQVAREDPEVLNMNYRLQAPCFQSARSSIFNPKQGAFLATPAALVR